MTQKSTSKQIKDKNGLTEKEFLLRYNSDKYPKPSLTADICVIDGDEILLIKRGNHPFLGCWALPGGFANRNEAIEDTAKRELLEETGLKAQRMKLVGVYSAPGRDPRGWTVSAAYRMDVDKKKIAPQAGDDAADSSFFKLSFENGKMVLKGKETIYEDDLAFDHAKIITDAFNG